MHNILDNSWNHDDFLNYLLNFDNSWHLDQFLHYFLHQNTNLLDNLLFQYDWNWHFSNHLHRNFLLIRNHLLNLDCHDFWLVLNIRDVDLDNDRLFLPQPDWNSLLNFNIPQLQRLSNYWFLNDSFNLQNNFLSIRLDSHNDFLFVWNWNFLDNWNLPIHNNLNKSLVDNCSHDYLFNLFDDLNRLLDCVGYLDWNLFLDLDDLWHLNEVVHYLFDLNVFDHVDGNLLYHPNFLNISDFFEHLYKPLFIQLNFYNLFDSIGGLIGNLDWNLMWDFNRPLDVYDSLNFLDFNLLYWYLLNHLKLNSLFIGDDPIDQLLSELRNSQNLLFAHKHSFFLDCCMGNSLL